MGTREPVSRRAWREVLVDWSDVPLRAILAATFLTHGYEKLFVNGVAQNEPYLNPNVEYSQYADEFPRIPPTYGVTPDWRLELPSHIDNGDLVIPKGYYFGMGDNRDNSLDSRFWGLIPRENVIGRPLFVYWSFETPPGQVDKTRWSERAAFLVHVLVHFFDETRWSRMFHPVH